MVRILNPVGEFKKEMEHSESGKMDLKMGDIPILSKVIVADENVELIEGKSVSIKIEEIEIPKNYITSIGAYASNRYGHPIAVGSDAHIPLSMDKTVNRAAFVVVSNGKIEKGDLLGFLSLFPVELINKNIG
ncbi:MAG: DUF22 domain-containing protein [Methanobrevibacter sp.]|jgi:hypothetical protein|nr:DUF22 domain-containing protein [Methanobrevibacter sp.]